MKGRLGRVSLQANMKLLPPQCASRHCAATLWRAAVPIHLVPNTRRICPPVLLGHLTANDDDSSSSTVTTNNVTTASTPMIPMGQPPLQCSPLNQTAFSTDSSVLIVDQRVLAPTYITIDLRLAAATVLMAAAPWVYHTNPGAHLPSLSHLVAVATTSCAVAMGVLRLSFGDKAHLELHRGRLYLQLGVPGEGPRVLPGSIIVQPTGDIRGNGAYAVTSIPRGTWLGDYLGDVLAPRAFDARYPDGRGDHAMAVHDMCIIDAAHLAPETGTFHPVHMNHSCKRANVVRFYQREKCCVSFFTSRDVQPGEELLYNYGRNYWRGREHSELP